LLVAYSAWGQVDPARTPRDAWPYWVAGVPGGISNYPVCVSVADYGAAADGVTDDHNAFTNAIAACTNGGAVYVPAGDYRLNTAIAFTSAKNWVLRGAGATQTRLHCYSTNIPFVFGQNTARGTTAVESGYTRGSSNLVVTTPAQCHVGDLVRFRQLVDDTNYLNGAMEAITGSATNDHQNQMFRITAIDSSTVTVDAPIYFADYKADLSPTLDSFTSPARGCGLESLGISHDGTNGGDNVIYIYVANTCWVNNCAVSNATFANIKLSNAYKCTVSENSIWKHKTYANTLRHSIQVGAFCTDNLVENNICEVNNSAMIHQAATGNVYAYNFSQFGLPDSECCRGGMGAHGDNANFNLYEGNISPWLAADWTWGSNRAETAFRNWITRFTYYDFDGGYDSTPGPAVYLDYGNYEMNIVGNVLGSPTFAVGVDSSWMIADASRTGGEDPQVALTAFLHANWDFNTGALQSSNVSLTLSNSFYLTSKPSWFGRLAWPPFGPDVAQSTNTSVTNIALIPAQARYLGLDYTTTRRIQATTLRVGNFR
jgi:hypothetical protein